MILGNGIAAMMQAGAVSIVGTFAIYATSVENNRVFNLPVGTRAGMTALLWQRANNLAGPPASPVGTILGHIPRASTTSGENASSTFMRLDITSEHINATNSGVNPNGSIVVPQLAAQSGLAGIIFSNVSEIVISLDPAHVSNPATTGFNQSASFGANSIANVSMTPGQPSIAVAAMAHGAGRRTLVVPSDYTLRASAESGTAANNRNVAYLATKAAPAGVATGTSLWSITGAADATMFTALALVR